MTPEERAHSEEYRLRRNPTIGGIIAHQHGRPLCVEMWPDSTADATTLIQVIERLRGGRAIGRVCVVVGRA